jgi:hypothetical protein
MAAARKGILGVLTLVAMLALAAPAAAQLSDKRARSLAVKLARQVASDREAVFWDLSPAVKVRSTRVVYLYFERTPDERFCSAKLVVTQSGRTRRAAMTAQRCKAVPEEVLGIERATRGAIRAVRAKSDDVKRSYDAYTEEADACIELEPPRAVQNDVERLLGAGLELALHEPVRAEFEAHVGALEEIGVKDRELAAGVISWRRWFRLLGTFPAPARNACDAVRRWASEDYAPEAAPVDFAELRATVEAYERQLRRMRRSSLRLIELGATPRVASVFVPEQMVIDAAL